MSNNLVGYCFWTYDLCNPRRRRMCTWRVFALIWSPVPQQLASFPGLKTDYSAVVLDRFQARPAHRQFSVPECWAGVWNKATLVSRGHLSSCSSSTPCFLLCPWLTQPVLYLFCCFNSVPGALSRLILRFFLRLLRCLRGSLREHDCATSTIDHRSFTLRTPISTTFTVRRTNTYTHTYIHTDTACVQHVNVGLAQARPK